MKWIILLFIFIAVLFDALSDVNRDKNKKTAMHIYEALTLLFLMFAGSFAGILAGSLSIGKGLLQILLTFVGLYLIQRLMFFDIIYNISRGLHIGYIGNTAWTDKQLRKIKMSPGYWLWARFILWLGYTGGIMLNYNW